MYLLIIFTWWTTLTNVCTRTLLNIIIPVYHIVDLGCLLIAYLSNEQLDVKLNKKLKLKCCLLRRDEVLLSFPVFIDMMLRLASCMVPVVLYYLTTSPAISTVLAIMDCWKCTIGVSVQCDVAWAITPPHATQFVFSDIRTTPMCSRLSNGMKTNSLNSTSSGVKTCSSVNVMLSTINFACSGRSVVVDGAANFTISHSLGVSIGSSDAAKNRRLSTEVSLMYF